MKRLVLLTLPLFLACSDDSPTCSAQSGSTKAFNIGLLGGTYPIACTQMAADLVCRDSGYFNAEKFVCAPIGSGQTRLCAVLCWKP